MKPLIAIKDSEGNVYTMPSETSTCILEVHYSTSYYQFIVQYPTIDEYGIERFLTKNIIVPLNEENWIDFIAVDSYEIGELLEENAE